MIWISDSQLNLVAFFPFNKISSNLSTPFQLFSVKSALKKLPSNRKCRLHGNVIGSKPCSSLALFNHPDGLLCIFDEDTE